MIITLTERRMDGTKKRTVVRTENIVSVRETDDGCTVSMVDKKNIPVTTDFEAIAHIMRRDYDIAYSRKIS